MRKITPKVDTFHGINNSLNPCSPQYRQGMAWNAKNSRINASGLWDKAAALSACSLGAAAVRGVPVSSVTSHPHFIDCNILESHYIAKNLKNNSHLAVGPNKYGYVVDDKLGSSRAPYWWDGTDASASKSIGAIAGTGTTVRVVFATAHNFHVSQIIDVTGTENYDVTDKTITATTSTNIYYSDDTQEAVEHTGTVAIANAAAAFVDNATACNYAVAGLGRPTAAISVATNGSNNYGGRMEMGTYYYMYTYYDNVRKVESLPSDVTSWTAPYWAAGSGEFRSTQYPTITITTDAEHTSRYDTNTDVRVYRSFRSWDRDKVFGAPNQFYFVGELSYDSSSMTFNDYAHDTEIENDPYEGRGSSPPTGIDCLVPFNNRMYYFDGNDVYWSSAGRPEEVALNYTLTYKLDNPNGEGTQTTTIPMQPLLFGGIAGEAKYEISELQGETVVGAYPLGNRLWVWTESTAGYLKPTTASEGVKYHLVRKGLGLVSSKTLTHTPYGLFGADRSGVWSIDANMILRRLSKDVIDIKDSDKSTYALQSTLTESFGLWVDDLDEYWWCVVNTGEDTVHRQIAYQPARRVFGGIYAYSGLTGGCAFVSTTGAQTFLTNSTRVDDTSFEELLQTIQLWMGQHSLSNVKDDIKIEIIYESITSSKTVSVIVYQNNRASTTGATTSSTFSHDSNNLVGVVEPHGSGRMFMVNISIPTDCQAPIISIDGSTNEIHWNETARR